MPETVFDQDRWDVYRVVIEFTAESFAVNTLPRDCRGSSQEAVAVVRRGRPLRDGRDEHLRGYARAGAKKHRGTEVTEKWCDLFFWALCASVLTRPEQNL